MQMSDTQRLLTSDLEVVVSVFPRDWLKSGKEGTSHPAARWRLPSLLYLPPSHVPAGRCCLPAVPAARGGGMLQSWHGQSLASFPSRCCLWDATASRGC